MNVQATFCATLVDEWARCGVEHAVIAPGSRSTPLALALWASDDLEVHVHHDERAAAFIALGIGKATGVPAVLLCTSGTAAAELHPAVVEAHQGRVPMLVCTADRPPELREVGAGQSIDQIKLYGSAVKWFVEVGNHEPGRETAIHHRALACRAFAAADGGPVHLNFGLREPLAPVEEDHVGQPAEGHRPVHRVVGAVDGRREPHRHVLPPRPVGGGPPGCEPVALRRVLRFCGGVVVLDLVVVPDHQPRRARPRGLQIGVGQVLRVAGAVRGASGIGLRIVSSYRSRENRPVSSSKSSSSSS